MQCLLIRFCKIKTRWPSRHNPVQSGGGGVRKIHSSLEVILNLEKTQVLAPNNVTEPIFENQYISKVLLATAIATGYEAPAYIAWSLV